MYRVDCVVIGGGVIGIAIARALALKGREVILIEAERVFGTGTSSRSSEVIHAGIYYPQGSLKARLCVEGKEQLYAYCVARGIPHIRCGKLIVAAHSDQEEVLDAICERAAANGVSDLRRLTCVEARALEPELQVSSALLSPSSGIIDSHALMAAMLGEAEANGALIAYGNRVQAVQARSEGFLVTLQGTSEPVLLASQLVNAAGLSAPQLARSFDGFPQEKVPTAHFAKGNYFALRGKAPFSRLVYPVPEPGGLGIHATTDLGGRVRFGPDVQWCDNLSYAVEEGRSNHFYTSIRRYWPGLRDGALIPDYCGIRPKLSGPGEADADFMISAAEHHGVEGLVHLFGIESPGLTASMAIGRYVAELLH